jgi:hypothetical protein
MGRRTGALSDASERSDVCSSPPSTSAPAQHPAVTSRSSHHCSVSCVITRTASVANNNAIELIYKSARSCRVVTLRHTRGKNDVACNKQSRSSISLSTSRHAKLTNSCPVPGRGAFGPFCGGGGGGKGIRCVPPERWRGFHGRCRKPRRGCCWARESIERAPSPRIVRGQTQMGSCFRMGCSRGEEIGAQDRLVPPILAVRDVRKCHPILTTS